MAEQVTSNQIASLLRVLRQRNPETDPDCHEAADEIERLTNQLGHDQIVFKGMEAERDRFRTALDKALELIPEYQWPTIYRSALAGATDNRKLVSHRLECAVQIGQACNCGSEQSPHMVDDTGDCIPQCWCKIQRALHKCRVYSVDDGDGHSDQMDKDDPQGDYYRAFDVDREIQRMSAELRDTRAALAGEVGLVQLLTARDDLRPERAAILSNHRHVEALQVLGCETAQDYRRAPDEPSADRLRSAACTLYMAARWTTDAVPPNDQAKMWEDLRDALGFKPGTATAAGLGASDKTTESR